MIRLITTFALAGLLVSVSSVSQARHLNSSERAEFARNFSAACMADPHIKSMIESFGGGQRELRKHCGCAGTYFARKLTIEQAFIHPESVAPSLHDQIFEYCFKKTFRGNRKAK